ncbi:BLUF domain-containing protein [Alteromonas sp. ASW11-19]|uniref:BLUF domain-containing protein n=1 Tax=Alteromonas salexigens TaxID=2982530 RepID=A0ABT2VPI8_9ALTE|nr:BLUF domain-containing protein [Alteromonas salexigens]MCU7555230.1 BLUF domain-containing protein [Alteromonas salexigens]
MSEYVVETMIVQQKNTAPVKSADSREVVQLLYTSTARGEISPAVVDDILAISRRNNILHGVTGLLLYTQGAFLQVLEGAAEDVERTLGKIKKDPRHSHLQVLLKHAVSSRDFSNWAMAYRMLDESVQGGSSDFLAPYSSQDEMSIPEGPAKQLMRRFRDVHMR